MNYEQLTAKQALEIAELRAGIKARDAAFEEIISTLVCIGGPLNDNMLGYTSAQLMPLQRILNRCEGWEMPAA